MIREYFARILRTLSVLLNVVLGGDSNQTFSARNYLWKSTGFPNLVGLIDKLLGKHHCRRSFVIWTIVDTAIQDFLIREALDKK